jgi:hypothetical protein
MTLDSLGSSLVHVTHRFTVGDLSRFQYMTLITNNQSIHNVVVETDRALDIVLQPCTQ